MKNVSNIAPTKGRNRIALLDILRGFALLGIFIVNIRYMSSSVLYQEQYEWMREGSYDRVVWRILELFFNSKFYPIFSFLFGLGLGMQFNKMIEKNKFSASFFTRRLFYLFIFGLIHVAFIWGGDVLMLYAIAGIIVLVLRKVQIKYLWAIAILLVVFPFYFKIRSGIYFMFDSIGLSSLHNLKEYTEAEINNIFLSGNIWEIIKYRCLEYTVYLINIEYFPWLMALVLTGFIAGKAKFYENITDKFKSLSKYAIISIICIVIFRWIEFEILKENEIVGFKYIFFKKISLFFSALQAFIYIWIISYLLDLKIGRIVLQPLAFAGRMSLTNYMMQSIIGMFLFLGIGFGLYGRYGVAKLGLIAFIIYILFIIGSKLWFIRFQYGPFEWVWRKLTYNVSLKFLKNRNNKNIKTKNNL